MQHLALHDHDEKDMVVGAQLLDNSSPRTIVGTEVVLK